MRLAVVGVACGHVEAGLQTLAAFFCATKADQRLAEIEEVLGVEARIDCT